MRAARQSGEAGLLTMGDLLGREQRQEISIGPSFSLGAIDQPAPHPAGIRQVQPLEERIEVGIGGDHDRPPTRREDAAVLARVQRLRCAPPLQAPAALWTRPVRGSDEALIVEGRSSSSNGSDGIGVPRSCAMYSAPMACSARPRSKAFRSAASPCVCRSACSRSTSGIHVRGRRCVSSVSGPDGVLRKNVVRAKRFG
jgi:hypothetical protein